MRHLTLLYTARSLSLVLLLAAGIASPNSARPQGSNAVEKVARFLSIAEEIRNKAATPGAAMAIYENHELVYLGGLGYRDVANAHPATEDTLFAIGSCTKAFTGVLASKLAAQQRLDWHDPVRKHLPELHLREAYLTENVSLHDLFTHVTGLGPYNMLWYGAALERDDLLSALAHLHSLGSLRRGYIYNNIAYAVAGSALERIRGDSWDTMIRTEILEPLGMTHSTTTYAEFLAHPERSIGYAYDGHTPLPHLDIDAVAPAGAIGSSAADMASWLGMVVASGKHGDETFLTREQFDFLTHPQVVVRPTPPLFYGIGWEVEWKEGKRSIGHGGGIVGQNCYVRAVPEAGFGIVILANQQSDFDDLLVRYAEDLFVHDELIRDEAKEASLVTRRKERDRTRRLAQEITTEIAINPSVPPMHPIEDYAGTYRHPVFGTLRLTAIPGGLLFAFNQFEGPVKHFENESFVAYVDPDDASTTLSFTALEKAGGSIRGLRMSMQGGAPEVVFPRATTGSQSAGQKTTSQEVDAFVAGIMQRFGIPGTAVAVLRGSEVIHRSFQGLVDLEAQTATSQRHLFRIYSLTKLFSSTAVFQLIEAGKLALDDPIGLYLEGLPEAWQPVRVEHLLSHSSGLPDIVGYVDRPEAQARAAVYADPIAFDPGTRYSYNQTNFWLLQRLIETVTGERYQDFVLDGQLGEAGAQALFSTDRNQAIPNASNEFFPFTAEHEQLFGYLDASNGLVLTLDAFVNWSRGLERGDLLQDATKERMWRPFPYVEDKAFAHAWDIHNTLGTTSYGFSGSLVTAYRTFPAEGLTVLFLGNGFREFFDVEDIVDGIAERYL